jgi:hypothetical protein
MYHLTLAWSARACLPVVIRSESDGRVERPLEILFVCVHLEQFEQGFGAKFCVKASLEGVLGLFLVM